MVWDSRIRRRLKLRDLDTFLAVAECRSMAKAAAQLTVSQPAVSNAIAGMEHTLGIKLFDRTAAGVEPTLYGRALLKWAVAVFDDVRQGVKEIDYLADPTTGELRVVANDTIIGGLLPAICEQLSHHNPGITVDVVQASGRARTYREMRERNVDVVLGRVDVEEPADDLEIEILFEEHLFVVAESRSRWARARLIRFSQLADEAWALPRTETTSGHQLMQAFRSIGRQGPRTAVLCNSIEMRFAMLATGRFLTVLPRSVLQFGTNRVPVKVLPVELPHAPAMPVGLITLKNRTLSPVVRTFIEFARQVAQPLARKVS
jgi:DNA-binding transcriptional LysR family regulator